MKSRKLIAALAAAGVTIGTAGTASAKPNDIFDVHASAFKEPGDKGRPDIFGAPGKPEIGPPGLYQG